MKQALHLMIGVVVVVAAASESREGPDYSGPSCARRVMTLPDEFVWQTRSKDGTLERWLYVDGVAVASVVEMKGVGTYVTRRCGDNLRQWTSERSFASPETAIVGVERWACGNQRELKIVSQRVVVKRTWPQRYVSHGW